MKLSLIHYGHDKFDINKFKYIENANFVKPKYGLWGSPIDSKYGWIDWGIENNYGNFSSNFTFEYNGNILIIDSYDDLLQLPFYSVKDYCCLKYPDFEKLSKKYDAILLTVKGEHETRLSSPKNLYGWDCESICIFNPKGIKII
jgi:hypothetical protein